MTKQFPVAVETQCVDLASEDAVKRFRPTIWRGAGEVSLLVNNAGFASPIISWTSTSSTTWTW